MTFAEILGDSAWVSGEVPHSKKIEQAGKFGVGIALLHPEGQIPASKDTEGSALRSYRGKKSAGAVAAQKSAFGLSSGHKNTGTPNNVKKSQIQRFRIHHLPMLQVHRSCCSSLPAPH